MGTRQFGARVRRSEDADLLRGRGRYVDDIHLPSMLHAYFVRSPHAHALMKGVDMAAARAAQGVAAVLAIEDLPGAMRSARIPTVIALDDGVALRTQHCLARGEVNHVGQPVAVVIARTAALAEDAAAHVAVDYDVLAAVSDARAALAHDAPPVHCDLSGNLAALVANGYGDVEAAFAGAAHVFSDAFWMHRGGGMAMETRAVVAHEDGASGMLTVWSSTQTPHLGQRILAELLARGSDTIRAIAPHVGGGFGPKAPFYPEEAVIPAAALLLGQPVKWTEDRHEHFLSAAQEHDQYWTLAIAVDQSGRILGLRGEMILDAGAFAPWGNVMPNIAAVTLPGPYVVPAYGFAVKVALTNKVATVPVRGAGRPQAVFAMERMLDRVARELSIDRAEVRRRNLIAAEAMPYTRPLVFRDAKPITYQSGDFPRAMHMALASARYDGFKDRQARARAGGRHIGIGIANYVEATGLGPFEGVSVRVLNTGKVAVATGAADQGQGVRTTLAQVIADAIGCRIEDIEVRVGDTGAIAQGVGAFASRQAIIAGSAALMAGEAVRRQIVALAARAFAVEEAEIEVADGVASARGGNRPALSFAALARLAQGEPGAAFAAGQMPGLEHVAYFAPAQASFCNGTHVAEVEVDALTGAVRVLDYCVGHDSGRVINPMIVEGQVQGGVAHGIGNALLEWMRYDETGQPLTTTFADYLLPTATDVPTCRIAHIETPNPLNPLGVTGAGEGGAIPAPAAIVAAIEDALSPYGVRFCEMPLTPERIVAALREAGAYARLAPI
ncbi:MAG: xanthine dehydrogenase family protein [Proteobacteria bacterium]|nr:xanthine dehydrogenase family protein [Pseudomonadota bacterium]